jgi:predicted transcriptional regulator
MEGAEKVTTLDEYLDGIRQLREKQLERKAEAEKVRDEAVEELTQIARELERIDGILGKSEPGRQKNVQAFVYAQVKLMGAPGATYTEKEVVARCREQRPSLSEASVLSALRRLAKKGLIKRSGSRYNREVELVVTVPSEAASKPGPDDQADDPASEPGQESPPGRSLFDGADQPT